MSSLAVTSVKIFYGLPLRAASTFTASIRSRSTSAAHLSRTLTMLLLPEPPSFTLALCPPRLPSATFSGRNLIRMSIQYRIEFEPSSRRAGSVAQRTIELV